MLFSLRLRQCLAILCLALLAACDQAPTSLRLALPVSGLDAEIAAEMASVLGDDAGIRLELSTQPASGEAALDLLASGQADLALISNYLPYREGITAVMPVFPSVLHIAHRQERAAGSGLELLSGAKVFAGIEGSASRLMFSRIARHIGLSDNDFEFVESLAGGDSPDADIVIVFAPVSPQYKESFAGYRLYSMGKPGDIGSGSAVDAATLLNPPLRPFIIPASTYGAANTEAIATVAVDKMLVARSDLGASTVYDLINELRRARPALAASRPGVFATDGDSFDVRKSTFVLHAGTQAYLDRDEPTVYERYSGIAEVVVTLMIALVSASFAAIRILRIRRKNRIDGYYSAALQLRNRLAAAKHTGDRESAIRELRELQDDAFAQLVDERLAADDSFRIFITLSNDILRQYTHEPE